MIAAEAEVVNLIARVSNFPVRLQVCIHVKDDIKVIIWISNESMNVNEILVMWCFMTTVCVWLPQIHGVLARFGHVWPPQLPP